MNVVKYLHPVLLHLVTALILPMYSPFAHYLVLPLARHPAMTVELLQVPLALLLLVEIALFPQHITYSRSVLQVRGLVLVLFRQRSRTQVAVLKVLQPTLVRFRAQRLFLERALKIVLLCRVVSLLDPSIPSSQYALTKA